MLKAKLAKSLSSIGKKSDLSTVPYREIDVQLIQVDPNQPRKQIDTQKLEELAQSIRANGLIQPIVVESIEGGFYRIIAGERRFRASKMVHLKKIPVIIQDNLTHQTKDQLAIVENLQRENLDPLEMALALKKLEDNYQWTHQKIGESVGITRSSVSNYIRLLTLSEESQKALQDKKISFGHAKLLVVLPLDGQVRFIQKIIDNQLSVKALDDEIKVYLKSVESNSKDKTSGMKTTASKEVEKLLNALNDQEGLDFKIKSFSQKKKSGKLVVSFDSLDKVEALVKKLQLEE